MSAPVLNFNQLIQLRIDIARAIENPPPRQRFIVGHLPDEPGVFGLIIGPDGARKSWLSMHIGISVAGGRPVAMGPDGTYLWEAPERGRVVYLASEDSANVLSRRLFSISKLPGYEWVRETEEYLDIIPTYSALTLLSLDSDGKPAKTQEYQAFLEYAKGARLIVIDPLADFFDISESDDRAARGVVQLLREMSRATGAGVIGVHHQNKIGMLRLCYFQSAYSSSPPPTVANSCSSGSPCFSPFFPRRFADFLSAISLCMSGRFSVAPVPFSTAAAGADVMILPSSSILNLLIHVSPAISSAYDALLSSIFVQSFGSSILSTPGQFFPLIGCKTTAHLHPAPKREDPRPDW